VLKRFDRARVLHVAWKIVRCLYFHHHGRVLPADHANDVSIAPLGREPPDHFRMVSEGQNHDSRGRYPGVFDYRFDHFTEAAPASVHYWALMLWDRIIVTVIFHDPDCGCEGCQAGRVGAKASG
jgi:hypothetical protein